MPHLKLQYFGHLMQRVDSLEKTLMLGKMEKAMAPHSSTLAWKIPWMEEPGGLQSMGSLWVGHNWATSLSLFTFMHGRKKWQPTLVFLPGEFQGWGSLVGCRLLGHRVRHDWSDLAAAAAGKDWRQEENGTTEDEMVRWHHHLNGYEFEQAPGDADGQESLGCCSCWVAKSSDVTKGLNTHFYSHHE